MFGILMWSPTQQIHYNVKCHKCVHVTHEFCDTQANYYGIELYLFIVQFVLYNRKISWLFLKERIKIEMNVLFFFCFSFRSFDLKVDSHCDGVENTWR